MNGEDHEVVEITSVSMRRLLHATGSVNYIGDPNSRDKISNMQPLHFAASNAHDNPKVIEALVNAGADVDAKNPQGHTPLHFAAITHNWKIADILLKYGANINVPDYDGRIPLHYVSYRLSHWNCYKPYEGNIPIAQRLLQNGAHVNHLDNRHETPLMVAIKDNHLDVVKEMLKWGADVHARNNKFETCLHIASLTKDCKIFMQLLKHGACTECFDQIGKTALDIILKSNMLNKFETAKQFLMMAILVNKGHWTKFHLREKNPSLHAFIQECLLEVDRMKTIHFANISLCDFILRDESDADDNWVSEKSIFDRALQTLKNFPIYSTFMENHFHRSYLLARLLEMDVYALCETGEIFLYSDIINCICSFLSTKDLLNFLQTFI